MKIFSIIFLFFSSIINNDAPLNLYGKWNLERIETKGKVLKPYETKYYLTIERDKIEYNLDIKSGKFYLTKKL